MKTTINTLLAGMMTAFCCSIGSAQIIYSNNFSLGSAVNINGTAPTVANDFAGGTSTALWNSVVGSNDTGAMLANGTVDTHQNSVLLPFTPESGYLYILTASVTLPSMTAGKWITMGFAAHDPVNSTTPRFNDSAVNGNPWMYATAATGTEQFYPLRTTLAGNTQLMPTAGTYTIQLELNTIGAQWISSAFVDGTQLGTNYIYAANPTIVAAGIGQTTLASSTGIQWNYLTLSTVPEPSVLALMGLGLAGLGAFLRRRK